MNSSQSLDLFAYGVEFWSEDTIGFDYSEELKTLLLRCLNAIPPEMPAKLLGYAFDCACVTLAIAIGDCTCNIVVMEDRRGAVLEFNVDELRYRKSFYGYNPDNNFTAMLWRIDQISACRRRWHDKP